MPEDHEINIDVNTEQDNQMTIFINHKVFGYDNTYLAAIGVGLKFDTLGKIADGLMSVDNGFLNIKGMAKPCWSTPVRV